MCVCFGMDVRVWFVCVSVCAHVCVCMDVRVWFVCVCVLVIFER